MKRKYFAELNTMPTIRKSHTDNLKFDNGVIRIWISRLLKIDGMPYDNEVTVEKFVPADSKWVTVDKYNPHRRGGKY